MTDTFNRASSNSRAGGFNRQARSTSALTPTFNRGQGLSGGQKVGGFFLSALESFPELFGIEPSRSTQEFRAQAPISGFASQAVGAFVPYLGAARVARAAPLTGRFIRGAEALGKGRPIVSGGLGMGAEALVVEGARIGIGASGLAEGLYEGVTGREAETRTTGQLIGEGIFNVAGSAVLGGAVGGIADRIRRGMRVQDAIPGARSDRPLPLQIRAMNEYIEAAQDPANTRVNPPEEFLQKVIRDRDNRVKYNLGDITPNYSTDGQAIEVPQYRSMQGRVYRRIVGERRSRSGDGQTSGFLNRLSKWNTKNIDKGTETRRLVLIPGKLGGFQSQDALDDVVGRILPGLEPDIARGELATWATDVRVVRVREGAGKPKGAGPATPIDPDQELTNPRTFSSRDNLQSRANGIEARFMHRSFKDVGDGWRMAKEENGLYVMAKKIQGEVGVPRPGDQWAFLRTDTPGRFAQASAATDNLWVRSDYLPQPVAQVLADEPMFDHLTDLTRAYGNELPDVKSTRTRLGATGSAIREAGETVASYATPSNPLVYRNPTMARAFRLIKDADMFVEGRIDMVMRGNRKWREEKSLFKNVMDLDPPTTNGLQDFIKALTKAELEEVKFILESEIPIDVLERMVKENRLTADGTPLVSPNVFDFFSKMQTISDSYVSRSKKLEDVLGETSAINVLGQLQARKGHYIFTREYPGSQRIFIQDEAGDVVGIASGKSAGEAREAAEDIIAQQAKRGRNLFVGQYIDETFADPIQAQRLRKAAVKPGFLKNRGDMLGYDLQRGELTQQKLIQLVEKNLRRRENWLKEASLREHLAEPMARLGRESPGDLAALQKIFNRSLGDEGQFAQATNAMMDKLTVGVLGKDSASTIVRTTQSLLNSFQMAFGNVTQPLLNGIGIFQTVFPEIAYVVHASPESLARNYVTIPLTDGAGNIRGSLGVLSEVKLMNNAFRRIGTSWEKQDPEFRKLVDDLISDRSLSPRYAEEQFGANGAILKNATQGFKDTESFITLLNSANEIMLSKTEELNRIVGAAAAFELGKLRGLSGLQLKVFAREFLAKTAFNYGTVDRAAVFTTPLGSLMGTFKNWMFHYMANMVRYSTSGKEALPALMWQTGSTALIGGAAASPLVMPVADAFSKWATNQGAMESIYDLTGPDNSWVADGLVYGLPGAMGISFASQAASPGSDPERDAQMLFSFAAWDRVKSLSTATKDALVAWKITGESPWEDENVRREMVRALAPRTFYRGMAVAETTAVTSMSTGYNVTNELGVGTALMYAAGFNPTELEKTYEAYNLVRDSQEAKRALVKEYGQTMAQAWDDGDTRLANRVYARAMATGVDMSSVLRSAQARQKRGLETQLEFAAEAGQVEDIGFGGD